jgi:hypothetical protein
MWFYYNTFINANFKVSSLFSSYVMVIYLNGKCIRLMGWYRTGTGPVMGGFLNLVLM